MLIPILRTIQGRSNLYIKNSRELKEITKDWRIERNQILVSYDVKNLYPSIPQWLTTLRKYFTAEVDRGGGSR